MKRLLAAAATILLIARPANAQTAPKPAATSDVQPLAVLLEQGIYQEETAGNLDAAAKTYHHIVEQAAVGRALVAQALGRLAALEVKQKQLDEARKTIERLKTEYPEQKDAIAKAEAILPNEGRNPLASRYAAGGGGDHSERSQADAHVPTAEEKSQAADLAKQGWQLYHDGKSERAEAAFRGAAQLDPKSIDALNGLGWTLLKIGTGVSFFGKVLELDPKNAVALNGMGWYLSRTSRKDEATEYWQKALDVDPTASSPMSGLAQSALDKNQFDEAIRWYEKWLSLDPKNADALLGLAHAKQGKTVIDEATDVAKAFFESLDDDRISDTHKLVVARFTTSTRGQFASSAAQSSFGGGQGRQQRTLEDVESAWDEFLKTYRSPMGKTISRTLESTRYSAPWRALGEAGGGVGGPFLPQVRGEGGRGAPWLPVVDFHFESKFENQRNASEELQLFKEDNGDWKVLSYIIKKNEVPRDPLKG